MNKLAIYACSGTGDQEQMTGTYELCGTNTLSNTQLQNDLLSQMNYWRAYFQYIAVTPEQKQDALMKLDVASVLFQFATVYRDDDSQLTKAISVVDDLYNKDYFKSESISLESHQEHVDTIISTVESMMDEDDVPSMDAEDVHYFVGRNKVGISQANQSSIRKVASSQQGWQDEDFAKYLNDAGSYFIYTFISDADARYLPIEIQRKRKKQLEVLEYCRHGYVDSGIYGTEESMMRIIRAKIIEQFKKTPEQVAEIIVSGSTDGVGVITEATIAAITAIAKLITAIAAIITTILTIVLNIVKVVVTAKYQAPANPQSGIADGTDFDGWEPAEKKKNKQLLLIGGAVALIALMSSDK